MTDPAAQPLLRAQHTETLAETAAFGTLAAFDGDETLFAPPAAPMAMPKQQLERAARMRFVLPFLGGRMQGQR